MTRIGSWDLVLKIVFSTDRTEFDMQKFVARALVSLIPCQEQLDEQTAVVRLNHGQGHRWGGRVLQCAVIRAESR